MVKKKNLEIGKEYIYSYSSVTRPRVLEYVGIQSDEPAFIRDDTETAFSPRLSDIYKPENLTPHRARGIIIAIFGSRS